MSFHPQNLPEGEQSPPNQPDSTLSIHADFIADTNRVVRNACTAFYFLDDILPKPGPDDVRISGQDVEEFWDNWINKDLCPTYNCQPIRGYWVFDNWENIGENAVVIVRYNTLQICIRAGPQAQKIIISSADVSDLVSYMLEGVAADETMAPFVMNAVCDGQLFQWLIVSVPQPCVPMAQVEMIRETLCVNPETVFTIHNLQIYDTEEWKEWFNEEVEKSRNISNLVERRLQELEGTEMEIDGDTDDQGDGLQALQFLSFS